MNTVYTVIAVVVVAAGAWFFLAGSPVSAPEVDTTSELNLVEPRERTSDDLDESAEPAVEPAETAETAPAVVEEAVVAEPEPAAAPVVSTPEPEPAPVATTPDPVTINISGRNFAFSQSEMRVPLGAEVTVNFTSTSGFHDWVVDEFDAATAQVNSGGSASVTFTADQAGTFEYYCSVGNHRAQGMVGNLIVE